MARYIGKDENGEDKNITPILNAVEYWKNRCLLANKSVFTDKELWTPENFKHLQTHYIENLNIKRGHFIGSLENQLKSAPPEVKQLVAEIYWFMMLMLPNYTKRKDSKIQDIKTIWEWSGPKEIFPETGRINKMLLDCLQDGIAEFKIIIDYAWQGLYYCTLWLQDWKSKSQTEQEDLLWGDPRECCNPWKFGKYLQTWEESHSVRVERETRQQGSTIKLYNTAIRHALLYLLFPDYYERILHRSHHAAIIIAWGRINEAKEKSENRLENDKLLYLIRKEEENKLFVNNSAKKSFDFYEAGYKEKWHKLYKALYGSKA